MSFLAKIFRWGSDSVAQQPAPIGALRVQTSSFGTAIPLCYGRQRVTGNLIWYGDFNSQQTTSGGGKGGTGSAVTGYTYSAAIMICLGEGVYGGIGNIWVQKNLVSSDPQTTQTNTATEIYTIPQNATILVDQAANYLAPTAVYYGEDDGSGNPIGGSGTTGNYSTDPFIQVTTPASITVGQYFVDLDEGVLGTYTFSQSDVGKKITIVYTYTGATAATDPLGALNMVFFDGGSDNASPWGYLSTNHPTQALNYKGFSYTASPDLALGSSPDTPNFSFELYGMFPAWPNLGIDDANSADIITDYLTNPEYGVPGFPAGFLGDTTLYRQYCDAAEIHLAWWTGDQGQQAAADHLKMLLEVTNSAAIWSNGQLKIVPYGEVQLVGSITGVVYSPNSTPVYDLTDDHYLDLDDPIVITRTSPQDAYNSIQVEYTDRSNSYNVQIVEARDQSAVDQYGLLFGTPYQAHCIADQTTAQTVAQLMLQRALYIRNQYKFRLGTAFCLLEPMDLVTLTDVRLGLSKVPVRIISIEEDQDGILDIVAEDWIFGTATASKYGSQEATSFFPDRNLPAGLCNTPVIFEPMSGMVKQNDLEIWVGTNGGENWASAQVWISQDNATYVLAGTIPYPSRTGYNVKLLPSGVDPDVTDTLLVDISLGGGQLLAGTQTDADQFHTLCWIDGEFVSYENSVLVGPGRYALSYLRRGAYGSTISAHAAQTKFIRVDDSLMKYSYDQSLIGSQVYIKILGINPFGGGALTLNDVLPYTYKITGLSGSTTGSGSTGKPGASVTGNVSITYTSDGFALITILDSIPADPSIAFWQARTGGTSFASGSVVYSPIDTGNTTYKIPISLAVGNTFYIGGVYSQAAGGGQTVKQWVVTFNANYLPAVTGVGTKINEPNIVFTWAPVLGAEQYAVYFVEGNITQFQLVTQPTVTIPIPKYSGALQIICLDQYGDSSPPFYETINETGFYTLIEAVNIALNFAVGGHFVNIALNNSNQVEIPSVLGSQTFTMPPASINSAALFTTLADIGTTALSTLAATSLNWFRDGWWENSNGYFESSVVDLGSVLTGVIKVNIAINTTFNGNTLASFGSVIVGDLADNTLQELINQNVFLTAQLFVSSNDALIGGNWQQVNNGDFVNGMRYAKIVITSLLNSPLTDVIITAGNVTLDVVPVTESGSVSVTGSQGITLSQKYHAAPTSVTLTADGNATCWVTNIVYTASTGVVTLTLNVSSGTHNVFYFVKGY
jgi:hypothetical protein